MVAPLRHRQTKGAATDMPGLLPPRHIPTLPNADHSPHVASPRSGAPMVSTFSTRGCRRSLLAPAARAMAVALDYIDCFAAAHSLASLAALEGELARL